MGREFETPALKPVCTFSLDGTFAELTAPQALKYQLTKVLK